ncbi:MAG TPA: tetratricopeptide repeat protein [Polyangiaceae bacterium]|nr:tetratricopeptide repeat protein [Polyangiaceae bacterium]
MCKVQAALAVALAVGLAQGSARAQTAAQHEANRRYKPQPLNLHKEQLGTPAYASDARRKMAAGDCEGALTSFDAALRTSTTDPTLYRDRGLCHEKLDHPYPAIDDYREYLTDAPDAPDADSFRTRLAQLEDETSGNTAPKTTNDDTNVPSAKPNASESISLNEGGATGTAATSRDKLQYLEREDDPLYVALRRGKGFAIAPFFSEHKWFFSNTSFGASETWAECVGLQLRYFVGPAGALLLEAGYEHFNATNLDLFTIGGLTSALAFEFRFPLDVEDNNQLFLAPVFGYEHISFSPSDASFTSIATNAIVPRLRFGYRHLVQDSASIDFSIDAGWAKWFVSNDAAGSSTNVSNTVMVAANVAIVWGL